MGSGDFARHLVKCFWRRNFCVMRHVRADQFFAGRFGVDFRKT